MKPRILLTGKKGQVGSELESLLAGASELKAVGREEVDLSKPDCVRSAIREFKPNVIINAAAYTAVDKAESEEALALVINAESPAVMAEEAKRIGAALVHYSTDYVFDGLKSQPYLETDPPNPINAYGRTKLAGERAIQAIGGRHLIFRTEWVYATRGRNYLLTILRLATDREELRIVADQIGAPTWSREIARATARIILDESQCSTDTDFLASRGGLYHMTAAGRASWYEFASAIVDRVRRLSRRPAWLTAVVGDRPLIVQRIVPIPTRDYPTLACRPAYSVLSNASLMQTFRIEMPDWQRQLRVALTDHARD